MQIFRRTALLVTLACLGAAACGKDDPHRPGTGLTVPESWAGVWRIVLTSRNCPDDSVLAVDVIVDEVCKGESVEEFLGLQVEGLEMQCSGSFTDANLVAHCTGRSELFGCILTVTADFGAARADSLFDGTGTVYLRTECSGQSEMECIDAAFAAERLEPAPARCDSTGVAKSFLLPRGLPPRR